MNNGDMTPREERIRRRAEALWRQAGEPTGRDEEFWNRAVQEIDEEDEPALRRPRGE